MGLGSGLLLEDYWHYPSTAVLYMGHQALAGRLGTESRPMRMRGFTGVLLQPAGLLHA
eukprot:SAG25_NODE_146_length_13831_cov_7.347975_1_plen_58_part_00